jgi:hypothetical protein
MKPIKVTRKNLREAVEIAMSECRALYESATRNPIDDALIRDLAVALQSLGLIEAEINGRQQPREHLSTPFIRYAVDEGNRMVMDSELRDQIIQIEDLYSRSAKPR